MEINEAIQMDLLRYIRTKPRLFSLYNKEVWDVTLGAAFHVLEGYDKTYGSLPTNFDTVYMFMSEYAASLKTDTDSLFGDVSTVLRHVFEQPRLDVSYLQSIAVDTARRLQAFHVFNKYLVAMTSTEQSFDAASLAKELHRVAQIAANEDKVERRRLFADISMTATAFTLDKIFKSSVDEINNWRNKGGFYAPELYVIAAPPKALKTMLLLNLALDFALMNRINVLYIDTENGIANIHQRGAQNITGATFSAYSLDEATTKALELLQTYGCDVYIRAFRPGQATYQDIEEELDYLAAQGIVITMIVYDYADNMVPIVRDKESHKNAAQVYLDLIGINMKYGTFSWTASQIKAELIKQGKFLEKGSLGQAVAKEHHAHAVYSLLGTKEERAIGLRRFAPITQREGVEDDSGDYMIYLRVDPASQRILGVVPREEVEALLEQAEQRKDKQNSSKPGEFTFISKQKFDSLDDK